MSIHIHIDTNWHECTHTQREKQTYAESGTDQHSHTCTCTHAHASEIEYKRHEHTQCSKCFSMSVEGNTRLKSIRFTTIYTFSYQTFRISYTQRVLCEWENTQHSTNSTRKKTHRTETEYYIASVVITVHRIRQAKAYTRSIQEKKVNFFSFSVDFS